MLGDTEVSKTNNFCSHGASKTNISNTDKYKEENISGTLPLGFPLARGEGFQLSRGDSLLRKRWSG